jgi:uncharacterized protein involved in exopolysaccharide biosynthesis
MTSTLPNEQTLRDIVGLVYRRRFALILFVASAMVSSLVITFVFSEKFLAATMIVYRPTDRVGVQPNAVVPDKTALGFPVAVTTVETVGATIEQVGRSERVLRRVVEELGLDQPEENTRTGIAWLYTEVKAMAKRWLANIWQVLKYGRTISENPTTQAIIRLAKNLSIESRDDYTSTLSVLDKNPQRAAKIVDCIGEVLVEEVKKIGVQAAQERSSELANRLEAKREEIKSIRSKLEQLKAEWNFHSLHEEMSLHLNSVESFETELYQNELQLRDARATLASLESQRSELEASIPSSRTVQDDPLYQRLQAQRSSLVVEQKGLLTRRGENHADVAALAERIRDIDRQLAALRSTRVTNEVTTTNPSYEAVRMREISARSRVDGLLAANDTLQKSIQRLRSRIIPPKIVSEVDNEELSLRTLEEEYVHLAAALEESRTEELADVPEVRVLYPATAVLEPVRPIRIYHIALSGLLAASLGCAVIFVAHFLNSLWNTPIPLMGSAPRPVGDAAR